MNDQDRTKQQLIDELAELRQSLDALMDNLPEGVLIVDSLDARVRLASRYGQQMVGVSGDEFAGIRGLDHFRYYQMYFPDGTPASVEQLPLARSLAAGEVIRNEEWLFQGRDGGKVPIVCQAGPVRDQHGTITGAVVSWQDVTARKQAEHELREGKRRLSTIISNLPGVAYRCKVDRQWTMEFISDGCVLLTGYTPLAFTGNREIAFGEIIHPEDREGIWKEVRMAIAEGKHFQLEYRIRTASGGEKWVWEQGVAIPAENGQVEAIEGLMTDITERKRIEESLRVSEAKYRRLYQSMMDAFVSVDMDGSIREYNEAYCKMLGYEPDELLTLRYMDLTPEKWHAFEAEVIQKQVLPRGYSDIYEKEYRREDGTIFPVELRAFLIRDDHGQPCAMWAIVRDVTQRKLAEEALQKARDELEQRVEHRTAELTKANDELRAIYDGMTDGLLVADIETRQFVRANASICRMLGYSEGELLSMSVADIHPKANLPFVLEQFEALAEGTIPVSEDIPVLRKDGSIFYAVVTTSWVAYDGRRHVVGFFRDVTERRQAEQALRQSHGELRTIYDQMADGVIIVDAETRRPVQTNSAFCRMAGLEQDEAYAVTLERVHPLDVLSRIREHLEAARQGGSARIEDVPFLRNDGSIVYADVVSSQIYYNERPGWISLFHDVTERKHAREALRTEHRTLKHLLQSSDHERQLIAYEIHDGLAQQLAGAIMQFQTFDHLKGTQPKLAAKAYDAGMTMLQQGHFETRRLIAGVRPPILDESGVVEAIAHLVNEQRRLKGPKIEYRSEVDFDRLVPTLENAIYRITQEALTNACKHSKSEKVRVSLFQQEDHVRMEIRDWGSGFDTNAVEENRFGLEGIRQRTRLLGGKCSIRSSLGKGTRIAVELPVVLRD